MRQLRGSHARVWSTVVTLVLVIAMGAGSVARADDDEPLTTFLTLPISSIDGYFPTPWACTSADPGTQSILQFHLNWHCTNPDNAGANWGNRFFGFHTQFTLGFDRYAASVGFPYTQTWVPSPGALIPPAHRGRAANAPCPACESLPNLFRLPAAGGTLDDFTTVDAIGDAIVQWHNRNHGNIGAAGGNTCVTAAGPRGDMACVSLSPRDPIFYRYHHIFDDVRNAWRTHQPTDIVLVLDRSGSMSLPAAGGGTRLEAARLAASMFADLLEDGSNHALGLASFSTTATSPVDLALTSVASAPAALNTALAGVTANGMTSIGAGLQAALSALSAGGNQRKAILLLTDGIENTTPFISAVTSSLGDTHLCSVGFGLPGLLDGPKLRDLSERQGGIYIAGPGSLELRKFFVECFADIFDSFVGEDPVETLAAAELASEPMVQTVHGDDKLTFVLSWEAEAASQRMRLAVTSPSGVNVDLGDPAVESIVGPYWHIVRVQLPWRGEQDGDWEARAERSTTAFVNGFMSDAFDDIAAGAELVEQQIEALCAGNCERVLFYEDDHMSMGEEMTFDTMVSAYGEALYSAAGRGELGEVVKVRTPRELAGLLRQPRFDLVVYSSRYATDEQPYDEMLARYLCGDDAPRAIVSDNRDTASAREILRCAGAERTGEDRFESIESAVGRLALHEPAMATNAFSYGVLPLDAGTVLASGPGGEPAVVARGIEGADQQFFITTLTRGTARVVPFLWTSRTYTGEPLHPAFHIPEMYLPDGEYYDRIEAVVEVRRPLRSIAQVLAEVSGREKVEFEGDIMPPAAAWLADFHASGREELIGYETLSFPLFDDGTNGDSTAGDNYWEASLPDRVTEFDGQYDLRAIFNLCRGDVCVTREAQHSLIVEPKMSPERSTVSTSPLNPNGNVQRARIEFMPMDRNGLPLGPGRADSLQVTTFGETQVESINDLDGRGTYQIVVSWIPTFEESAVSISQFGRPEERLLIELQ